MLMQRLGIDFGCDSPDIDETADNHENPEELVLRLAETKATHVGRRHQQAIVIGSDQVSVCKQEILGKPGNREKAILQLKSLSGESVVFYTGLCVVNTGTGKITRNCSTNIVHFRELTAREIENYVDKEQPFDCAGAFKSESLGITLMSKMEGDDPTALIGLPLIKLSEMLRSEGIALP